MILASVDPGRDGSVAFYCTETGQVTTERLVFKDGLLLFERIYNAAPGPIEAVYVEKVGGRGGWAANANFSFGSTYGQIRLGCKLSNWYTILVEPKKWQKVVHEGIKAKTAKEKSRLAYARLFPDDPLPRSKVKTLLNHNDIDATLIVGYAALMSVGKIIRPGGIVSWSRSPE